MICHITLRTSKLNETVEFYDWLLGLTISRKLKTPRNEIVFLGDDETKFELIEDQQAESINTKCLTIGFLVDDLDEKLAMLDDKQIPHSPVISPSPGARFSFFADLNGCGIQLFEEKEHI